ncbi:hypothetical protein EDEG_00278 [Edhazardia aedis USNM 41457]|uniref:H/ACA ribonucleoprotein complex subunit CBF5 n=1 Tax=Edhazardia aedis (strain USNM 41457) TaxID=1003232 RepID=J9DIN7_EDHAE|nr:hypothetical protein EDEG_00278 [Edhazardia aedis USNM 41457]|eukprot:EJW02475.1 hypothetical protein EDEG_00278 [Edhazardia aedis USNM 41457]
MNEPSKPNEFPLLLKDIDKMHVKTLHHTPLKTGFEPLKRPLLEHLKYGVVFIDKVKGPSSHEIVTWVKDMVKEIFDCKKTGHCGTLDPQVSGCLPILIERATRLAKIGQSEGKEYICTVEFGYQEIIKEEVERLAKEENSDRNKRSKTRDSRDSKNESSKKNKKDKDRKEKKSNSGESSSLLEKYKNMEEFVIDKKKFLNVLNKLTGEVFQRPPKMCAVKRNLRLRKIYKIELIEIHKNQALIRVFCEAGTYIRTLCQHIGLLMGYPAFMKDLRRSKSGLITENECVTLHDLLDSIKTYTTYNLYPLDKEIYLRRVIKPLESLLLNFKRIIIKDTAVNAVCHGGQLTIPGILRFDDGIEKDMEIVLVSSKGEAVAICVSLLFSSEMKSLDHGIVCKIKRVVMERNLYPKSWKLGKGLPEVVEVIEKKDDESSSSESSDDEEKEDDKEKDQSDDSTTKNNEDSGEKEKKDDEDSSDEDSSSD